MFDKALHYIIVAVAKDLVIQVVDLFYGLNVNKSGRIKR